MSITLRQGSRFGFWNAMPAILTGPRTLSPKMTMLAGVRRHQPGDELHQRGLAAAGRADDGGELAAADVRASCPASASTPPDAPSIGERDVVDVDGGRSSAGLAACRVVVRPEQRRARSTRVYSFRSAAGGRYWLVKMSSAFGRFLKS